MPFEKKEVREARLAEALKGQQPQQEVAEMEEEQPPVPVYKQEVKAEKEVDLLLVQYEFELIKTYELYKPTKVTLVGKDSETVHGKSPDDIYPPTVTIPNKGVAYDEETKKQRAWRFINSEPSIWIDEQREIEPPEEQFLLGEAENMLQFQKGHLFVRGIEKSKFQAMCIQDFFEGKKVQLKPQPPLYRLLDKEVELKETMDSLDEAYQAEKCAREASVEDMKAFASVLGISTDMRTEAIRKDFIVRAKAHPSYFLKHFRDERNKIAFVIKDALKGNVINANDPKMLRWGETQEAIFSLNPNGGDITDQITSLVMQHESKAVSLYDKLRMMK